MKFSVKLKINRQRVSRNNEASLFFQVLIDDTKTTIPLDLKWNIQYFDDACSMILPISKKDVNFNDYKLLIEVKRNEINEVFKYYRLADKTLTAEILKNELKNMKSREDFIVFFKSMINNRFEKGLISEQTRKNNNSSLKMLERFQSEIRFKDINQDLIMNYQIFIKRQKSPTGKSYRINTVAKYLTDMKCYLAFARNEGIVFDDPFKGRTIATSKGSIVSLDSNEVKALWEYFNSNNISETHKTVLRPFLFSCFTGLRHSDLERVSHKNVKKNKDLEFEPYKTRELQKQVVVPLCEKAFELIQNQKGELFRVYSNQKANERLKEIADNCNICKNISTHVARHTFATQFLEQGGKLEVLKELLGHSKIETTMVYVHVTLEHKRAQIGLMDNILKLKTAKANHFD